MQTYKSVDEYIKKADKGKQGVLKELRALVKKSVPSVTESIAYGMPAYSFKDKPLFYFAAMKGHLGLYPTPSPIKTCKDALKDFSTSKGCVRVPYKVPLPKKLVTMLLKERVKEIKTIK